MQGQMRQNCIQKREREKRRVDGQNLKKELG